MTRQKKMGQNFKQVIHRKVNIILFIRKREGKNWFLSGFCEKAAFDIGFGWLFGL